MPFPTRGLIEALAVVLNQKKQSRVFLPHRYLKIARFRMLHGIVQRFLDNAIDAGLVFFGQHLGNFIGFHFHRDAIALGDLARLPAE